MSRSLLALAFALALATLGGCNTDVPASSPLLPAGPMVNPAPVPPWTSPWTDAALKVVSSLTDEELKEVLDHRREVTVLGSSEGGDREFGFDTVTSGDLALTEAVRRGGKAWEAHFEGLARKESRADLDALTALRRIQGRPDPLEVLVVPSDPMTVEWPGLPTLNVVLRNAETEGPPLVIGPENFYRGGFLREFRFEFRERGGTTVPIRRRSGNFGGAITSETLHPGDTWKGVFNPANYVPLPPPGVYEVRAQYAENCSFSCARDLRGWVYYSSRPVILTIAKRRIELTRSERKGHEAAISDLPEDGPIRFVAGTPVEDHPEFIPPDSPEGRLLRAGWKAIPALLDAAEAKGASPIRRARVFALLFGITGANNPYSAFLEEDDDDVSGVMAGAWEAREGGPRSSLGGQGGAFVLASSGSGGKFDPEAQETFAERWRKARAYVEIVER